MNLFGRICFNLSFFNRGGLWSHLSDSELILKVSLLPCRSLNMDCENQEKDKDGNPTTTGTFNNSNANNSECSRCRGRQRVFLDLRLISGSSAGIQTIDSTQALFLPIGASVSLLVMFFFFDSVQVVFTICTAGERGSASGQAFQATRRVAVLAASILSLTAVLCSPQFLQQLRLHSCCCRCANT